MIFVGMYVIIFNINTIYGITLNIGILIVIGIAIVLIFIGVPLGLFKFSFDRSLLLKRYRNCGRQSLTEQRIRTIYI
jgi:hypothetical protein